MENITIQDLVDYTKGKLLCNLDGNTKIEFIANDSRTQGKNWAYLALRGERLDGHEFVEGAKTNGAILSIVEKEGFEDGLVVEDSYLALKNIATEYRKRFDIPTVAITGSSGKTTTKDMVYFALNESEKSLRNIGNLNSEIGLPMTVLNLDKSHKIGIFEMGMYHLGEIDYLAEIVKPNIGIITNVGTAHILNLKTRENILKAKLEIANYMCKSDHLLINGDNDLLQSVKQENLEPKLYKFGLNNTNDIYAKKYVFLDGRTKICAKILDEEIEFTIPAIGEHNILNALSALGVAKILGHNLIVAANGLAKYQASKYRMEKSEVGEKTIINDSYNANPDSMRAALSTLNYLSAKRRVAILADMLELGDESPKYHTEIGKFAAESIDFLIAIGNEARYFIDGAKEAGMDESCLQYFENNEQAMEHINSLLKEGDGILIKGSRGMKLEEVAEKIC